MSDLAPGVLWLTVLLPALAGGALVLTRPNRVAAPTAIGVAGLTVVLSAVAAVQRPRGAVPFMAGADVALRVDGLSALVLPAVTTVTVLVLLFSAGQIGESPARFHGLMLLFASAAALTVVAASIPTLLLAWEVMGATSYALIGFWWHEPHRVSAGLTAFVTTRAADLGLYLAAAAALAAGAGLSLDGLADGSPGWRHAVALGVLVAALGKAAQLPFSFWLSRAMEGPSPVSALLHSAAMVAMGGYLLLRTEPLLAATGWAAATAAWVGAGTALLLGAVALAQPDLKQLLAASTAAQLGFVVMGAGLGAVAGGAAHLVAHASTKALLFLAAGAWLTALGTKQLTDLSGAARRWPVAGWSATVAALALAGIAPLSLWATKDAVLTTALEHSVALYAVGAAGSLLSTAYAGKVLVVIWRPASHRQPAASRESQAATRPVGALAQAPLVVLAVGAAVLGLLALPPVAGSLADAVGQDSRAHAGVSELVGSAVVALLVLLAVSRWRLPEPGWAATWLGVELFAQRLVVAPTLRLASALARFDDHGLDRAVTTAAAAVPRLARRVARFDDRVLDRGVHTAASGSLRAAGWAGRVDDRRVDAAVERFASRMRRLGELARRPQTGQLHQYYLQAVVVLAGAVLLLVVVR